MAETQKQGQPTDQKPDEWQQDLKSQPMPGRNFGLQGSSTGESPLNAYEIKELYSQLKGFSSDEMKQITVLPTGAPLEHGSKYVDLMDSERKAFTAGEDMKAGANNRYVAKKDIDHILWGKLTDASNPE
ncbi:hypothetical protein [Iningainema tapete]|uniref:Uncharacterized protein n=1 Tax=Iningainema tapete BLCC-T55 TaxID=2748662 RepID=A0A8J6XKE6_9CYAN|nr:hypothetical protein [Iningainema tapete]MBD2776273.1 hypothetical protein [Iningainema tapete BLCC-T55]